MALPKYSMLTLLVGLTSFDVIQGRWLNEIDCFLRSGVRVPRSRQLLSLDEFNEKVLLQTDSSP